MKRLKLTILFVFLLLFIGSASNLHSQTFETFAKEFMEKAFVNFQTFKNYCDSKVFTNDCDIGYEPEVDLNTVYNNLKPTILNARYKIDKTKNEILIYIDDFYQYDESLEFVLRDGKWKLRFYAFPC